MQINLYFLYFVLVFILAYPFIKKYLLKEKMQQVSNNEQKPITKFDKNKCSKECCNFTQWPAPHMPKLNNNYIPTNLNCNGGEGGGCLCVSKDNYEYLSKRARNNTYCEKTKEQPTFKCNLV